MKLSDFYIYLKSFVSLRNCVALIDIIYCYNHSFNLEKITTLLKINILFKTIRHSAC